MKISIQIEPNKPIEYETKRKSVIIGRSPDCDLVVSHPSISRKHCQIEENLNSFIVIDLGSSNGTFVGGIRLIPTEKQILMPEQEFTIGKVQAIITISDRSQLTSSKINSPKVGSNTKTLHLNHLDNNLEVEDVDANRGAVKVKGSRNPVAEDYKLKRSPNNNTRNIYIGLFVIVSIIVGILMFIGLRK